LFISLWQGARSLFTLNDPPYLKTGLTPAISANTLNFHFNGHHKAYLNKTNDLIKGTLASALISGSACVATFLFHFFEENSEENAESVCCVCVV
jgi:superoxide dismutase